MPLHMGPELVSASEASSSARIVAAAAAAAAVVVRLLEFADLLLGSMTVMTEPSAKMVLRAGRSTIPCALAPFLVADPWPAAAAALGVRGCNVTTAAL